MNKLDFLECLLIVTDVLAVMIGGLVVFEIACCRLSTVIYFAIPLFAAMIAHAVIVERMYDEEDAFEVY